MKLALGWIVGLAYVFIAFLAYRNSASGWSAGHADLGFWWAVIGSFLAIAALAALVGSWLHSRGTRA